MTHRHQRAYIPPLKRPTGVTVIAALMFLAAVSDLLLPGGVYFRGIGTVRGFWVLVLSGFYIALGVGLLSLSQWARVAAMVAEIVNVALVGVALVNGLLRLRPIFLIARLLGLPLSALIIWYLLKPEIGRAFAKTRRVSVFTSSE